MRDGILASDEDTRLLAEVVGEMDRRAAIPGGAARQALDERLLLALRRLARPRPLLTRTLSEAPPRPIAVAMALTAFSQPHMVATFGRPGEPAEGRPALAPVLIPPEALSDLLGLARWELDELQGEVDRRVAQQLRQHRALGWLWGHFGLPRAGVGQLVEVLLPGIRYERMGGVGLSRRGGQLYALVEQPRAPRPAALYLGWLDREVEGAIPPRGTFSGRYVDRSLRRRLGRSIGADPDEVARLLDRMVTVVPRQVAGAFLALDRWRALSYDAITGIAGPYPRSGDLGEPLAPDAPRFEGWLRRSGDAVEVVNGKALFDSLALDRVGLVARQLHAHNVATLLAVGDRLSEGHRAEELLRYDVRRHLRASLEPILGWARDPEAVAHVARRLGVSEGAARQAMDALAEAWRPHLETTWLGAVQPGRPASVAVRLAAQLVRTRHSLYALWSRPCAEGQEHREALLLFAGHYFAEAPLDRLLGRDDEFLGEDPLGAWFWRVWLTLLGALEVDSTSELTFQF